MSTYLAESGLARATDGQHLDLSTALGATPQGLVANPTFFTGFVDRPDVLAAGLLSVADVAATRYADVGLAARLANLDPVVTGSGDRLRFESFSACNGVYARFDLLAGGLGGNRAGFGTTNIDINQPLRVALATVGRAEALHLSVGREELRASTLAGTHVERKVTLPDRWVRGFAEVPLITRGMRLAGQLSGPRIAQLLSTLPRTTPPGPTIYLLPHGPRWLVSQRFVPGSVTLAGASRVRGVERSLRFATRLSVYTASTGASAWVFDLPAARLTLAISPDPYRGFSGEGGLLDLLVHPEAEDVGLRLLELIGWDSTVDPGALAGRTGLQSDEVAAGLAWLAACGRLGYDLSEQAWFHRDLPVEPVKVLRRNPRLVSAERLAATGGVTVAADGWHVRGQSGGRYRVNPDLRCTCRWEERYEGGRGPCKHILAVLMLNQPAARSADASLSSGRAQP